MASTTSMRGNDDDFVEVAALADEELVVSPIDEASWSHEAVIAEVVSIADEDLLVSPIEEVSWSDEAVLAADDDGAATNAADVPAGVELVQADLDEIPTLVQLELLKEDPKAVAAAMDQLHELMDPRDKSSAEWKKKKREANLMGAAGVVVHCMRKWQMSEAIQIGGCQCLLRFAYNDNEGTLSVVISGGIEAVVNAMKAFPGAETVQWKGSCAIRNVFINATPEVRAISRSFVKNFDGLQLLVDACKQFPACGDLQESCCVIFKNLAKEPQFREFLLKAGVVSAVAAAMESHLEDADIQHFGRAFMDNMYSKK